MRCSATVLFLSLVTWISIGLYVGGGYSGLSQALELFEIYGPIKGRGNPALDDPPNMWVNPDTNEWEPINPNEPGNRVPQVFAGVQYFLIAWAVFMFANSVVIIVDSIRSRKAIQNSGYRGSRTSDSAISCTAWLVGYCIVLAIAWFIQAGFAVLPLLEYRITMQRCWDLNNKNYSPTADEDICVDLVQYGLVLFKETRDAGYALVCGPGGSYNPPRGDLKGFCENYYPTFVCFLLAFIGAGTGMIAMILFAVNHSSNFSYLKVRRFEGPAAYTVRSSSKSPSKSKNTTIRTGSERSHPLSHSGQRSYTYPYVPPARENGVNLYNPNYGSSLIMTRDEVPKPVPEVMSFQRYHTDEDEDIEMQTIMSDKEKEMKYFEPDSEDERYEDRGRYTPQSRVSEEALIAYTHTPSPPPYHHDSGDLGRGDSRSDDRRPRHHRHDKRRPRDRKSRTGRHSKHEFASSDENNSAGYTSSRRDHPGSSSHRSGRPRRHHISDDDRSGRATSDDEHLSKASSRKRRGKVSQGSSRGKIYEEDESPASDFYMNEDRERSRSNKHY